jgi:hypothetical protein
MISVVISGEALNTDNLHKLLGDGEFANPWKSVNNDDHAGHSTFAVSHRDRYSGDPRGIYCRYRN